MAYGFKLCFLSRLDTTHLNKDTAGHSKLEDPVLHKAAKSQQPSGCNKVGGEQPVNN